MPAPPPHLDRLLPDPNDLHRHRRQPRVHQHGLQPTFRRGHVLLRDGGSGRSVTRDGQFSRPVPDRLTFIPSSRASHTLAAARAGRIAHHRGQHAVPRFLRQPAQHVRVVAQELLCVGICQRVRETAAGASRVHSRPLRGRHCGRRDVQDRRGHGRRTVARRGPEV